MVFHSDGISDALQTPDQALRKLKDELVLELATHTVGLDRQDHYLPAQSRRRLVSRGNLRKVLPLSKPDTISWAVDRASATFLITILCLDDTTSIGNALVKFKKCEFDDTCLPVSDLSATRMSIRRSDDWSSHEPLPDVNVAWMFSQNQEEVSNTIPSDLDRPSQLAKAFGGNHWDLSSLRRFYHEQWSFLLQTFDTKVFKYDIEDNRILPFKVDTRQPRYHGGFGDVIQVKLLGDYLHPHNSKVDGLSTHLSNDTHDIHVAVKQFRSTNSDAHDVAQQWEMEIQALREINKLEHRHIVRGLGAFRQVGKYHLLFEWANGGTLDSFWALSHKPFLNSKRVLEALEQILGLTDALCMLHNDRTSRERTINALHTDGASSNLASATEVLFQPKTDTPFITLSVDNTGPPDDRISRERSYNSIESHWRHGDIKPSNILRFTESGDSQSWLGTLKLADLGSAKHHSTETQLRATVEVDYWHTMRYEPPDLYLDQNIPHRSRLYDIWCLGCVYLELITWMVWGVQGPSQVDTVTHNAKLMPEGTPFWTRHGSDGATVSQAASILMQTLKNHEPLCNYDSALRDLVKLIEEKMLVVDLPPTSKQYVQGYRANASHIRSEITSIIQRAKVDPDYLLSKQAEKSHSRGLGGYQYIQRAKDTESAKVHTESTIEIYSPKFNASPPTVKPISSTVESSLLRSEDAETKTNHRGSIEAAGRSSSDSAEATNDAKKVFNGNQSSVPVAVACVPCRSRYLKCDGGVRCTRCRTHNVECTYVKTRRGWKGKRKSKYDAGAPEESASRNVDDDFPTSITQIHDVPLDQIGIKDDVLSQDDSAPTIIDSRPIYTRFRSRSFSNLELGSKSHCLRNDIQLRMPKLNHITQIKSRLTREFEHTLHDTWHYESDDKFADAVAYQIVTGKSRSKMIVAPTDDLCASCRDFDPVIPSSFGTRTLSSLRDTSEECDLCANIYTRATNAGLLSSHRVALTRDGGLMTINGRKDTRLRICRSPHSISNATGSVEPIAVGLPKLNRFAMSQSENILRYWLEDCDRHNSCMPPLSLEYCPKRLLDLGTILKPHCRLVETTTMGSRRLNLKFAAFSHPWGASITHKHFKSTRLNHEQHLCNMVIDDLPENYRDAIRVCRAIGIEYLWIDSICILQAIDEDLGDFKDEAAFIQDIYSSAYCVIAASSAKGTSSGFLNPRTQSEPLCLAIDKKDDSKGCYYLSDLLDDFQGDVLEGPLNERGWVMQERALARRTIFFTEKQVYYECGQAVRCETLSKLRSDRAAFLGDSNFPAYGMSHKPGAQIYLIASLYEHYSSLSFTQYSDKPIAISGMEQRLTRKYGIRSSAGVFYQLSGKWLLWERAQATKKMSRIEFLDCTYSHKPPSWSFMSYVGAISYINVPYSHVTWNNNIKLRLPGNSKDIWLYAKDPPGMHTRILILGDEATTKILAANRPAKTRAERSRDEICITYDDPATDKEPINTFIIICTYKLMPRIGVRHYVLAVRPKDGVDSMRIYERVGAGWVPDWLLDTASETHVFYSVV